MSKNEIRDGDFGMPPKKRNWKKGTFQIGLFIRTPDGGTMISINDCAPKDIADAALAFQQVMFEPKKPEKKG